uniref:Uncharacterized protein n=1 Tax=viral metagenome TaxID=1070528 RepID=A0A6H2A3A3_9ZZZZ
MKPSKRKYTGPTQFFHNYEHDPEGRTHCLGPPSNPYAIIHKDGKNLINTEAAKGHGKTGEPQWFKFKKVAGGFDVSSGKAISVEEVTNKMKRPSVKNPEFKKQKEEQLEKKNRLGH